MKSFTQEAVNKSLEAGWKPKPEDWGVMMTRLPLGADTLHTGNVFTDPTFWKCLGVSLGWGEKQWQSEWKWLIQFLIQGQSEEDFFKELLAKYIK